MATLIDTTFRLNIFFPTILNVTLASMNKTKTTCLVIGILLAFSALSMPVMAQSQSNPAEKELAQLLHRFLEGASENNAAMHDRFWAEDLTYTSSSGERYGKEAIMSSFENESAEEGESPSVRYSADNIQIKVFGDVAVVAFRLVAEYPEGDTETGYFLNSGTFVKRDGQWKAVNWQATRVPEREGD